VRRSSLLGFKRPAPRSLACSLSYGRWSYLGLGEPLCFLAFGPLSTCAFYLAQVPVAQVRGGLEWGTALEATAAIVPIGRQAGHFLCCHWQLPQCKRG
jgi:hypothetical protein